MNFEPKLIRPDDKPNAVEITLQSGFVRFGTDVAVDPLDVVAVFRGQLGQTMVQLRNSPSGVIVHGVDTQKVIDEIASARLKCARDLRVIAKYEAAAAAASAGRLPAGVEN
ncbi:MAG: hypothetical protein JSS51_04075 [Planctomycetes bacterium]|nr:hypothetical protein [Planctomycetota bacterium]